MLAYTVYVRRYALDMLCTKALTPLRLLGAEKPVSAKISFFDFLHVSFSLDCYTHCCTEITSMFSLVYELGLFSGSISCGFVV